MDKVDVDERWTEVRAAKSGEAQAWLALVRAWSERLGLQDRNIIRRANPEIAAWLLEREVRSWIDEETWANPQRGERLRTEFERDLAQFWGDPRIKEIYRGSAGYHRKDLSTEADEASK